MISIITRKLLMFVAVLFVLGLSGCNLLERTESETIAVEGTWLLAHSDWADEQWNITESSITYQSVGDSETTTTYAADIVSFSNDGVNNAESELVPDGTTEGLGYAVIRFTEVNGPATGEVGKYQIFRWGTNQDDSAARDFTQGFKNAGEDWPGDAINEVFDTPEAAEAGATIANGHFSFASTGAVLQ